MAKTIALHVTYDFPPCAFWGVGGNVSTLVSALSKKGTDAIVVTRNRTNEVGLDLNGPNKVIHTDFLADHYLITNPYSSNDTYTDFDLLMAWNTHLESIARQGLKRLGVRPTVVHNHGWMTWRAAYNIAAHFNIPIISSYHFLEKQYVSTGNNPSLIDFSEIVRIENESIISSLKLIVFSNATADLLKKEYSLVETQKLSVIPHGIDLDEVSKYKSLHMQSIETKPVKVLFVGRLVKEKGIELLLPVAQKIAKKLDVKFSIVGDGNNVSDLQARYGSDRVEFLGYLPKDKVYSQYCEADILCQPSFTETFGLSVAEGMAFGLPIITTEGPTMPKHVKHMETGLLVKLTYGRETTFSQQDLYNALWRLITDKVLRKKFSNNCLAYARDSLNADTMAQKVLELYEDAKKI